MLSTVGASLLAPQLQLFVAADEWNEAAFGGEAVVNPVSVVYLTHRSKWIYGRCVAVVHQTDRSLVPRQRLQ